MTAKSTSRKIAIFSFLAAFFAALIPASAQQTYTHNGTGDNNNAYTWEATFDSTLVPPTTGDNWDQTVSPGSLLNDDGAVDDIVLLLNNRDPASTQRLRSFQDIGTIGRLEIGGEGVATGTGTMQLQMRAGSSLVVTGPTILGKVGPITAGQRVGQINMNNGTTNVTLDDVVSGSTNGGNLLQADAGTPTLTLNGDIDTSAARAAAGVTPAGDDNEIDLRTNDVDAIVFAGGPGQTLNVENFDVANSGSNRNAVQTVPGNVTIDALQMEVGRSSNGGTATRTVSGSLDIVGGTITTVNDVRLGHVVSGGGDGNGPHTVTATLNIGNLDGTIGGSLTVGDELRLAHIQDTVNNNDSSDATVVLNAPDSVLTVNDGLLMGTSVAGTPTATIDINDGLATIDGAITDNTLTTSTINVFGGELVLLEAIGLERRVDTVQHDTTVDFLALGSNPPFDTSSYLLAGFTGGSIFDITTPAADSLSTTQEDATSVATGTWQTGATWDTGLVPGDSAGAVSNGDTITLVNSFFSFVADLGGAADAAALGDSDGGWTLTQNSNTITANRTGPSFGAGPARAVVGGSNAVTSAVSLNIQNAAGQGADASALETSGSASLSLSGGSDLILGGAAIGNVDTTGTSALIVTGNLLFGGGGTQGGTLDINGGTVTVTGDIVEGVAGAPDAGVNNAQVFIDAGTNPLAVAGGNIIVQALSVAQDAGSTASQTLGGVGAIDVTTTGTFRVGTGTDTNGTFTLGSFGTMQVLNANIAEDDNATGTFNIDGDFTSLGRVYVAGDQTGNQDDSTTGTINISATGSMTVNSGNTEIGRDGDGFFNVNGGSYTQLASNLVLGQDGTNPDTAEGTMTIDPGSTVTIATSDININHAGGTITQTGGDVTVGSEINMGPDVEDSSYTMSSGTLDIAEDWDFRGGSGVDTVTLSGDADVTLGRDLIMNGGTNNVLEIVGSSVVLDIVDELRCDGDSTVRFTFDGSGNSAIQCADNNLNGAILDITGVIPTSGSYTLLDIDGTTSTVTGTFAGLPEGAFFTAGSENFQITYVGGSNSNDTVITHVAAPIVTVSVAPGSITEGGASVLTFTRVGPTTGDIDITIGYTGSADNGTDYTAALSAMMPGGVSTTTVTITSSVDGEWEGCEVITANIDGLSGSAMAGIGAPSSATILLNESNVAPQAIQDVNQVNVGTGTVPLKDIVVVDPDASYSSTYDTTTSDALYHYTGQSNTAVLDDGTVEDGTFTKAGTTSLGYALELDFIPSLGDLSGTVMVWETGGSSNGSSLYLAEGVPHLLIKAQGTGADFATDDGTIAGAFNDLDFDTPFGNDGEDDVVVVPLIDTTIATPVTPGEPLRIALTVNMNGAGNAIVSVTHSTNGTTPVTTPLSGSTTNQNNNNWQGNATVSIGQAAGGGTGGISTVAGSPFSSSSVENLENGPASVSCVRFYNETTGTIDTATGTAESLTATLTIAGWSTTTDGTLTGAGLTDLGGGVWETTGTTPAIVLALSTVEFVPGGTTTYPVTISLDVSDGSLSLPGTIKILATEPSPLYVDDDFSGDFLDTVGDADDGTPGVQPGTLGENAFASIAEAFAAYSDTTNSVVINDGTYDDADGASNAPGYALTVTGSGGSPGGSSVAIGDLDLASTNSLEIDSNALQIGDADGADSTIECPITGTTGTLTKVGGGGDVLQIRNTCTFTGDTDVRGGTLQIGFVASTTAPLQGSLASGTIDVTAGTILQIGAAVDTATQVANLITGEGQVQTFQDGTVEFTGGGNTFTGDFRLGDGAVSSWDGVDQGAKQGFVIVNDPGDLGDATLISSRGGQLQAGTPGLDITNDIDVGGGGLRMGGSESFELSGFITLVGGGRGITNAGLDGTDITISGVLNLDDGTPRQATIQGSTGKDNGNFIISGDIEGTTDGAANFVVDGTFDNGIVTLSGINTYPGVTNVNGGSNALLLLEGTHTGGNNYNVNNTGTLGGSGTTDSTINVNGGGTIAPSSSGGTAAGVLTTNGDLTVRGAVSILVEDTNMAAGAGGYGQVIVAGAVDVTTSDLELVEASGAVLDTNSITIVDNGGVDAVIGIFNGLPEGGTIPKPPGQSWGDISYVGGTGNDITVAVDIMITSDDIDGDFISNFLEEAFDTDPMDKLSGREGLPTVARADDGSTVTIRYRDLDTDPAGRTYDVEESTDGAKTWSSVGAGAISGDQTDGSGTQVGAGTNSTVYEFTKTVTGVPLYHLRVVVTE